MSVSRSGSKSLCDCFDFVNRRRHAARRHRKSVSFKSRINRVSNCMFQERGIFCVHSHSDGARVAAADFCPSMTNLWNPAKTQGTEEGDRARLPEKHRPTGTAHGGFAPPKYAFVECFRYWAGQEKRITLMMALNKSIKGSLI